MLVDLLEKSNYTVVYTGAGMSTESGFPDFRSAKTGLWEKEDPALIASTEALNRDVEQFFHFYRERVLGVKDCKPHKGHEILARWEKDGLIQSIITQNVDGFHSEAGQKMLWNCTGHCKKCIVSHVKKSTEMRCTRLKIFIVHVVGSYVLLLCYLARDSRKRHLCKRSRKVKERISLLF